MKYSLFRTFTASVLSLMFFAIQFSAIAQQQNLTPAEEQNEQNKEIIDGEIRILTEAGGTLDRLTSASQQGTLWVRNQFDVTRSDAAYTMEYFQNADQMYRSQNPGDYLFLEKKNPLTSPDGVEALGLYDGMIQGNYEEIKGTQDQKDKVCDAVVKLDILANDAYQKADQIVNLAETKLLSTTDQEKAIQEDYEKRAKNIRRKIAQQRAITEFYLQKTRRECLRGKPPVVSTGGILPGIGAAETQQAGNETAGLSYVRDSLLPGIANALLTLSFALGVIGLILIGMMYVLSELNRDLIDKAKEALFWIFIGLIIAILSFAIVQLVLNVNFLG